MASNQPLMETTASASRTHPAKAVAAAQPRTCPLPCLLPAMVSGGMLWACYHPLSVGWLAWVALVPLLTLVRSQARPRNVYFAAWAGGGVFFVAALQWMRVADPRMFWTWFALAFYCSLYFPLAIWLTRVLDRRTPLPLVVSFPAVWVALEYVRTYALTGFPWYFLAHSQHDYLTIIQVTDLGGAYAVSVLVAVVNALAFDLLYQFPGVRGWLLLRAPQPEARTFGDDWPGLGEAFLAQWRRGLLVETIGAALLVAGAYVYGGWRLGTEPTRQGPVVALLQGNLDQRIRNDAHELAGDEATAEKRRQEHFKAAVLKIGNEYQTLCKLAARCRPQPDIFIWPETSDPLGWVEVSRDLPVNDVPLVWRDAEQAQRERLREEFRAFKTPQLLGIGTRFLDSQKKQRLYNSALLVTADGNIDGRYDKMHRVPFGEYVPLREWLPFMNWFAAYDYDYSIRPGEEFTRFALDQYRFGVLICFEDTDPSLARQYVRGASGAPPVDFLVNISNDGWFDGTSEHEEHLAVSRFRAIECRRALVRSVNMGISAVIDGSGRVLKPQTANAGEPTPIWYVQAGTGVVSPLPDAQWASFKRTAGVLVAAVPIDDRFSLYALAGDWLAWLCGLVVGAGTAGAWLYRRFRPATLT